MGSRLIQSPYRILELQLNNRPFFAALRAASPYRILKLQLNIRRRPFRPPARNTYSIFFSRRFAPQRRIHYPWHFAPQKAFLLHSHSLACAQGGSETCISEIFCGTSCHNNWGQHPGGELLVPGASTLRLPRCGPEEQGVRLQKWVFVPRCPVSRYRVSSFVELRFIVSYNYAYLQ